MAIKVRLHMVNLLPPQSSPSFTSATSPYPVFVKITPIKLLSPQSSFFFSSSHLPSRGRADPSLLPEELIHWSPRHRSSRPGTPSRLSHCTLTSPPAKHSHCLHSLTTLPGEVLPGTSATSYFPVWPHHLLWSPNLACPLRWQVAPHT